MASDTSSSARSRPIRFFVVEDDPHTRARLVETASADDRLTAVGSAECLADARAAHENIAQADVLLVDLGLPDGDGVDLIREYASAGTCALVISVFGDERHVVRAIEAGASGYLLKDADNTELADAIVRTVNGESPLSPSIARHLLKHFRRDSAGDQAASPLTPRETEVLTLVARGCSNGEIARLLEMSANTVTTHTKSIYRKLAVGSRSEAVFEAAQLGIINLSDRSGDRA